MLIEAKREAVVPIGGCRKAQINYLAAESPLGRLFHRCSMQVDSFFDRFLTENPDWIERRVIHPDFTRTMTIARYEWGYAIETDHVDDEGIVTLEVLTSVDGVTATLINRERSGENHCTMKSYPRDSNYPVGCHVRLTPCRQEV